MRKEYASLRRRTFLTPLWVTGFAWLVLLGVLGWVVASASTTTVLVMRHAEKQDDGTQDPPLSAAGQARAQRLAGILDTHGGAGHVQAIFATQFRRTQQTAAPAAERLGLKVQVVAADRTDELLRQVLHEYRGERILVIGHSNTVPEIVRRLAGATVPPLADDAYGDLFVIAVPRFSRPSVTRLQVD